MNSLSKLKKYLLASKFLRDVSLMSVGAIYAAFIPFLLSPILTRIYDPIAFGVYSVFMGVILITASFVDGRYSLAINLPQEDKMAKAIVYLCMLIGTLSAGVILLLTLIYLFISKSFFEAYYFSFLLFVPFVAIFIAASESLKYWLIRNSKFKQLAISRITQVSILLMVQIGFGFLLSSYWGLLIGQLVGYIVVFLLYLIFSQRLSRFTFKEFKTLIPQFRTISKRYINFPKFTLPSDLIGVSINQMPTFLLSIFFGAGITGLYGLTNRVLLVPFGIVSKSVLDVFKDRASADYRNTGNCEPIFKKTALFLLLLSVIPFSILFIYAPVIFEFVFGPEWRVSGEFARVLVPMYFFRFISSPLSYVFIIAEKQKLDLQLHIYILISVLAVLYISFRIANDPTITLLAFSLNYSVIYIVYLMYSFKLSKGNNNEKELEKALLGSH